jgi:polysaccharide biosynthesis protein PslH
MRILFLAHRVPYPPNKGEKLRAFWLLRELAKKHTIDLFCFYDDPEDRKHAHALSPYCHRLYLEQLSFGKSRFRALGAAFRGQPFTSAFFYSPRMRRQVALALRSVSYDQIFVFSSSMAEYAAPAGDLPKVLDLVDVDSDKWRQYAKQSSWPWSWLWRREARLLGAFEARFASEFSRTVLCTDAEARLLRSNAPTGKIAVLENFLDVDAYTPPKGTAPAFIRALQPYLIFSGSMDYRPNVDAVLFFYRDVVPMIRRTIPELRLVVAGRNPHRSVLALKRDTSVTVTGSVSDMRPYLWGASAAVAPMRIARGVQNKILEALAAGIPVITSSPAASALDAELRSLLTVADSPQDLSDAVIRLVRHGFEISSQQQRFLLTRHIETLDLPWKLERLLQDVAESHKRTDVVGHNGEPSISGLSDHSVQYRLHSPTD